MEENVNHKINVTIVDRTYTFTLPPEMEGNVRNAVDRINERVKALRGQYANKDVQDLLSIAVLEMFVHFRRSEEKMKESDISEEIDALNKQLEQYLKNTI